MAPGFDPVKMGLKEYRVGERAASEQDDGDAGTRDGWIKYNDDGYERWAEDGTYLGKRSYQGTDVFGTMGRSLGSNPITSAGITMAANAIGGPVAGAAAQALLSRGNGADIGQVARNAALAYGLGKVGGAAKDAAGGGTWGDVASGAAKGAVSSAVRGGNVLDGVFKGATGAGLAAAEKGLLGSIGRPDVGSSEPFPVTDTYQLEPAGAPAMSYDPFDFDGSLTTEQPSASYDPFDFDGSGGSGASDIWRTSLGGVGSGDDDWLNTLKSAYSKVNDFIKGNKELSGIIAGGIGNMAKGAQAKDLLQMKLDADEARRKAYNDSIINQKPATGLINSNPLAGLKQKYGV